MLVNLDRIIIVFCISGYLDISCRGGNEWVFELLYKLIQKFFIQFSLGLIDEWGWVVVLNVSFDYVGLFVSKI